jgi:hypothetical protein
MVMSVDWKIYVEEATLSTTPCYLEYFFDAFFLARSQKILPEESDERLIEG